MRIIVTGCRDWRWPELVRMMLNNELDAWLDKGPCDQEFIVVHGDCPTGADAQAEEWCAAHNRTTPYIRSEPHPALAKGRTWPSAGPLRNLEMAEADADLCLAFWAGAVKRSGTHDCIVQCVLHGITVVVTPAPIPESLEFGRGLLL